MQLWTKSGAGVLSLATILGGGAIVSDAEPALAACDGGDRTQSVQARHDQGILAASGKVTNLSGGKERWCDLTTSEQPLDFWDCVSNYSGGMHIYTPAGDYVKGLDKGPSGGCAARAWFYFDELDGSSYVENQRFKGKWRSDSTGGTWRDIGVLVD